MKIRPAVLSVLSFVCVHSACREPAKVDPPEQPSARTTEPPLIVAVPAGWQSVAASDRFGVHQRGLDCGQAKVTVVAGPRAKLPPLSLVVSGMEKDILAAGGRVVDQTEAGSGMSRLAFFYQDGPRRLAGRLVTGPIADGSLVVIITGLWPEDHDQKMSADFDQIVSSVRCE